ncbi:MAG: hypothetical protein Kow0031_22130 [Anaerolineae bacterium]
MLKSTAMNTLWKILKKSTTDLWDEMLYMVLFNLIWFFGTLLILPWPFVTFALYYIAIDVADGKGINWRKFWSYGRQNLKAAYIWGGVNLVALGLMWFNVVFYSRYNADWAQILQLFFLSLMAFWLLLQHVAVVLYPRLVEPDYRLALRNAAILVGKNPVISLVVMLLLGALILVSAFFPALALMMVFSYAAIIIANLVHILLKKELAEPEA